MEANIPNRDSNQIQILLRCVEATKQTPPRLITFKGKKPKGYKLQPSPKKPKLEPPKRPQTQMISIILHIHNYSVIKKILKHSKFMNLYYKYSSIHRKV